MKEHLHLVREKQPDARKEKGGLGNAVFLDFK